MFCPSLVVGTAKFRSMTDCITKIVLLLHYPLFSSYTTQSYTMRNGVLGVMGETVAGALSSPSLDEQSRITRDKLLDRLEQHLHDVNAFVRSRCLQIWLQLANAKVSITTDNTSRKHQKAPFGRSIRTLYKTELRETIFFCQFKPY